ncbi:MAG: hypothetical protein M3Y75_09420 [Actinomycetota bacterium]|nr:hypothetical protein [Actinomycetota bacterium]
MARIALVVIYVIGVVIAVISLDANGGGGEEATIWVLGVSVLLGAGTGDFRLALLSALAVPIAIPFGLPAGEGDPLLPTWVGAMYFALFSSALILVSAFVREVAESRLRRRRASRGSGIA